MTTKDNKPPNGLESIFIISFLIIGSLLMFHYCGHEPKRITKNNHKQIPANLSRGGRNLPDISHLENWDTRWIKGYMND